MKNAKVIVEIDDTETGLKFRLRQGKLTSSWGGYQNIVMLGKYCAATQYYVNAETALTPISHTQMLEQIAVI